MTDFILFWQTCHWGCMYLSTLWLLYHTLKYCHFIEFGSFSLSLCLFLFLSIFTILAHDTPDIDIEFISACWVFNLFGCRFIRLFIVTACADIILIRASLHMRIHCCSLVLLADILSLSTVRIFCFHGQIYAGVIVAWKRRIWMLIIIHFRRYFYFLANSIQVWRARQHQSRLTWCWIVMGMLCVFRITVIFVTHSRKVCLDVLCFQSV